MAKSQIFGYNHDLQVDKEALFKSFNDCELGLIAMNGMMETAKFNEEALNNSLVSQPLLLATDIAEHMVKQGTPFRIAYKAVANTIRESLDNGLEVEELVDALKANAEIGESSSAIFGNNILDAMSSSINSRTTIGGTSKSSVEAQIKSLLKQIS